MANPNTYIKLENVTLEFFLYKEKISSLKEFLIKKLKFQKQHTYDKLLGLNGVNLNLDKGDRLGIIGLNGSGKSTLLKTIAKIYTPTYGKVEVNGIMAPLIEIGAGFNPELTGRENIFLNGAFLGYNKRQIAEKVEQIIDFAEIREFIDSPVKYYSSGMYLRLAFTLSTEMIPDILILDEILGAGDLHFQKKAKERLHELIGSSKIVVIVSHLMEDIKKLCNRAICIHHGEIVYGGTPDDTIDFYFSNILHQEQQPS